MMETSRRSPEKRGQDAISDRLSANYTTFHCRSGGLSAASLRHHVGRQPHIQRIMERAEADHAKADQLRMARDVSMMFDELKALADRHAPLHADQARLQAELDQARAELARARRPWWR
jgi:multidrug resistance efflux pump